MNHIRLQQTLPQAFARRDAITSQIWHQDIIFSKGKRYLIEAASGTGKSSLCSYIYGYRRDYQGIINFDERNTLFEAIGIPDKINERAGKLSFGQQQRVAFIRSLCQPFDFIFLDEPISHLDNENSVIMSTLLMEEAGKQGAGIIVTSIGKHPELEYDETFRL